MSESDEEADRLLGGSSAVTPASATRAHGETAQRYERRCWPLVLFGAVALAVVFTLNRNRFLLSSPAPLPNAGGSRLAALKEPRALAALRHLVVRNGGDADMLE